MSVTDREAPGALGRLQAFGRPPRLLGIDVARGLAVLGMVGAHVGSTPDELTWSDPSTWDGVVNGRSSLLFALLAGVSITLVARGRRPRGDLPLQTMLVRRGLAVLAIGLVVELLNAGVAVILPLYGLLFVLSTLALHWSTRRLWTVAAALAVVAPFLVALLHALSLGAEGPGLRLTLFGIYPVTAWVAFLLAGMAIGRLPLRRTRTAAALLLGGVLLSVLGYGAGHVIGSDRDEPVAYLFGGAQYSADDGGPTNEPGWGTRLRESGELERVWSTAMQYKPHTGGAPELVGSGGFAAAVVGLCLLLARPLRLLLLPVAALGSMPLTAYTGHLVVVVALAGGPFGGLEDRTNTTWAWMSLGLVVAATAWVALVGRGPLERLVARVSRPPVD
jgi:uncharacterized membrane protein YeiB